MGAGGIKLSLKHWSMANVSFFLSKIFLYPAKFRHIYCTYCKCFFFGFWLKCFVFSGAGNKRSIRVYVRSIQKATSRLFCMDSQLGWGESL